MSLRARDIMRTNVLTVRPDMSLGELEDFLLSNRISGAPVAEQGALIGIISRSDIVRALSLDRTMSALVAEQERGEEFAPGTVSDRLPESLSDKLAAHTVRDSMTPEPITVTPETPVAEVARLLVSRHVHRVLVMENQQLRGVITSLDVVRLIADRDLVE